MLTSPSARASAGGGEAVSWGSNGHNVTGQLGNGSFSESNAKVPGEVQMPAAAAQQIVSVAAGNEFSLALTSSGQIYTWGGGIEGDLGDGGEGDKDTPQQISLPGGEAATQIAAGTNYAMALGADGQVYSWGRATVGELGDGQHTTNVTTPTAISALPGEEGVVTQIAAGSAFAMALTSHGQLYEWGLDDGGQVGNGKSEAEVDSPELVTPPTGAGAFTKIGAGLGTSVALTSSGKLYAWGYDSAGEIGDGKTEGESVTKQQVALPEGTVVEALAVGESHTLALTSTGAIYTWGANGWGELGNGKEGEDVDTPTLVAALPGRSGSITALAAGEGDSFALTSSGQLYAWGRDEHGQLGIGTETNVNEPQAIDAPAGTVFEAVAAAPSATQPEHTLAVLSDAAITTASLSAGEPDKPYDAPLAAVGGLQPYTWSASGLPSGLEINRSTGAIAGTPSAEGTATVEVTLTDADGVAITRSYQLTIGPYHEPTGGETKTGTEAKTTSTPSTTETTTQTTTQPTTGQNTPQSLEVTRALSCTTAQVALIDVLPRAGHVLITGAARQLLAGQKVSIVLLSTGRTVATPTVSAAGTFSATVPLPAAAVRYSNSTRYEAEVGDLRSLPLKLERRAYLITVALDGAHVHIAGGVTGAFRPGTPVRIGLRTTCASYRTVATVKLTRAGTFAATVPAPSGAAGQIAVYRAATTVLEGAKAEPTYTLPLPPS